MKPSTLSETTTESLQEVFKDPPIEYRMTPLFKVADSIDPVEVRWQLRNLKQAGFGGIFIYCARFHNGAPDRILSDWWWDVLKVVSTECATLGLQFWVYDDEDWPSGSVGGQLVDKTPDAVWKYLKATEHAIEGPAELIVPVGDGTFVGAVTYQLKGESLAADTVQDVSSQVSGNELRIKVPTGKWVATIYSAHPGKSFYIDGYPDLMDRKAMASFVDMTYRGHHERLKQVPGLDFRGYFTDEPAMSLSMINWGERFHWYPSMPWSQELAATFKKRHGYDMIAKLPLLYNDVAPESLRFRCHYWETCCHLYHVNYFGQIYDFCEENGLQASGHLVVEEKFVNHLSQQGGNIVQHYRKMHVPGIDWIHPFEGFTHLPANTPKLATSMAHLMGRERTWCESFAASGWGLPFQDMRRIVNWEHVNGINMQIPITYRYSLRKPEQVSFYPPGISYQQPWFDHFRAFADYEARLCALAAGGGHVAQLILAHPAVDIWSHCWDHQLLFDRGEEFNRLGDALREAGYDYDIFDDEAIVDMSRVESGKIVTEYESFRGIVMPRSDAVRLATLERCVELVEAGGIVVFVGTLPLHSFENGSSDPKVDAALSTLFGAELEAARKGAENVVLQSRVGGRAIFAQTVAEATAALREVLVPDVLAEPIGSKIFGWHRSLADAELYLLYNYSPDPAEAQVTVSSAGFAEYWNPESGVAEELSDVSSSRSGTAMNLSFQAYELKPVIIRPEAGSKLRRIPRSVVKELPLSVEYTFTAEETTKRPHIAWNFQLDAAGWETRNGYQQFPKSLRAGDWRELGFPFFSGIGHYETSFDLEKIPEGQVVILDLGRVGLTAEVIVNSERAGFAFFEPYHVEITNQVKPGHNTLKISVANSLSNYFSQFPELDEKPFNRGGDLDERRTSGLLGPVKIKVMA